MKTLLALAALLAVQDAAAQPATTLRLAMPVPIISFGNPYTRDEGSYIRGAIFDSLTLVTRTGGLQSALAESWELESPTSWVFRLRQGISFANGEPFNAEAVVRNLALLREEGALARLPRAVEIDTITEITALDAHTINIRTKAPDPLLPRRLNMIAMVAPNAWQQMGVDAFARAPVGTGPYKVARWREGNSGGLMEAVPTSWRQAKDVKAVDIVVVADPAARIKALMAGQVDVVPAIGPDDVEALREAGFQVLVTPGNSVLCIAFRTERPEASPLKDVRVRHALNHAVDKHGIVAQILSGTTRVASQGSASNVPGHDETIQPVAYDPAKAKTLLAEAGYPNGFDLTIAVYGGLLPNDSLIFQKVAQDLGAVGVRVQLRTMVFADYVRRLMSGEWEGIDAFSNGWLGGGLGDPIRSVDQFSCAFHAKFFCAPEVMPAIDATRTEMDPARREALMRTVMRELNNVGVALWLVEFSGITALTPRVGDYDTRDNTPVYEKISLQK